VKQKLEFSSHQPGEKEISLQVENAAAIVVLNLAFEARIMAGFF
jgi:hypothetical protein